MSYETFKKFVGSVMSLLLASSVIYAYGAITINTSKIAKLEANGLSSKDALCDIKVDINTLREGQREILKILINFKGDKNGR